MDILTFLNENITTKTSLSEILDVFCKMCEIELPKSIDDTSSPILKI